jgi:endonuclease/exonuclease/phosphatase family metal-dependent hydrolase
MRFVTSVSSGLKALLLLIFWLAPSVIHAQSNVTVRVMAANLNGNSQKYEPFALRIFQGTKPDVVAIQEFNYTSTNGVDINTPAAFREMVDIAFGTNFIYYREPHTASGDIPNGVISRYPIVASGSWTDSEVGNRGFAWARIDLPGTNDLYVVSVHLLTSSASERSIEATELKTLIQSNFPTNAWVVLAGDFNTDSRTESTTMTTCDSYLSDFPVPVDNNGNSYTSQNRNHPHDYVLPSFALTNFETATVLPSHSFPSGLVFDSTVYTPLSDVPPVQFGDSTNAQHMAVMKDFSIPAGNDSGTNPPAIVTQPQGQTNAVGASITFSVGASGSGTLACQWLFNGTNISGATANSLVLANAQLTNNGNYSVIVTNLFGSVTSSNAVLLLTNAPPAITKQPSGQAVIVGQSASFGVTATGTSPLNFQWLFNGTNILGATTNPFTLSNAQLTNAGNYSVVITNFTGGVTSSAAALSILTTNPVVFAQWNFNSPTPDGSTATGTTSPSTGSGTALLVGGTTATFATGDTSFDPAGSTDNSGWNTTTYPAQGTGNKTRGVQFTVSTAGKQNIVISWTSQSSNTGSKYGRLQYTTNGIDFVDFPNAFTNGTSYTVKTNSLTAISGVNNNTNFAFRFVSEFESSAAGTVNSNYVAAGTSYGTGGTMRYDMVTVSGTAYIVATNAALTSVVFTNGQFTLTVNGSTGASYVVQTSTNLASTNWIPALTNVSPFNFGDADIAAPQKFYRAVAQ